MRCSSNESPNLPTADLTRFVLQDDGALRQSTLDEKTGDRRRRWESGRLDLHEGHINEQPRDGIALAF